MPVAVHTAGRCVTYIPEAQGDRPQEMTVEKQRKLRS